MSLPMAERLDLDDLEGPFWPDHSVILWFLCILGEEGLGFMVARLPLPCVGPAGPGAWETPKLEAHEVVV